MPRPFYGSLEQVWIDLLQTGFLILSLAGGAALVFGLVVSLLPNLGSRQRVTPTEGEKVSYAESIRSFARRAP